ncbi:MAG: hypothetical protein ABI670_20930 [Chloroflexota bacterium]
MKWANDRLSNIRWLLILSLLGLVIGSLLYRWENGEVLQRPAAQAQVVGIDAALHAIATDVIGA